MFAKLSTELPSCSYLGCHHSEFEAITNRFGNPEKGDTTHRREDIYEFHSADLSSSNLFVPTDIRDALDLVRLSLSQCLPLASHTASCPASHPSRLSSLPLDSPALVLGRQCLLLRVPSSIRRVGIVQVPAAPSVPRLFAGCGGSDGWGRQSRP